MARCPSIKPNGERCRAEAIPGAEWCYSHDPERAEERRLNASKGGKRGGRGRPARPGAEGLQDIRDLLKSLTDDILSGDVERATAIAANQLLNTALRAIEVERKWRELDEIEERLSALEDSGQGVNRWG
jgi:hypothetical protein